jgi:hypothetical protein
MRRDDDSVRLAVEEVRRANEARRAAVLALSKAERLKLVAELCLQRDVLPPRTPRD